MSIPAGNRPGSVLLGPCASPRKRAFITPQQHTSASRCWTARRGATLRELCPRDVAAVHFGSAGGDARSARSTANGTKTTVIEIVGTYVETIDITGSYVAVIDVTGTAQAARKGELARQPAPSFLDGHLFCRYASINCSVSSPAI